MSRFKSIYDFGCLYFVSTTLIDKRWGFLNTKPYVDIVLNSLEFLRENKQIKLFAFVIMPNHLHLILKPLNVNISQVMHSLKSYTSKKIIAVSQNTSLSQELITKKVWEAGFFDKNIESEKFLLEKMDYVHNNPVNKNWLLTDERSNYRYSSACFYDCGIKSVIDIDDVQKYYF